MRCSALPSSTNTTVLLGRPSTTTTPRPDVALAFFTSARDASTGAGSRIRAKGGSSAQTRFSPVFLLSALSVLCFCERRLSHDPPCLRGFRGASMNANTTSASWKQLDRAKSLDLAHDEKLSGHSVGAGRLRLKTLAARPVQVAGGSWPLPSRADIGLDLEAVLGNRIGHDSLLVVENLQTFDDIHEVGTDVMGALADRNPLVLYRGDAQGGARADAVHALIERTTLPVYAFVDFDPAGLIIASAFPRLDQLLSPELVKLESLIRTSGITRRYLEQVAAASHALERLESDPRIGPMWEVIRRVGKALPQEYFHRRHTQNVRRSI